MNSKNGPKVQYIFNTLDLLEVIKMNDDQPPCENHHECRSYQEQKNVAYCRSSMLAERIREAGKSFNMKKNLYYVKTLFKTEIRTGWSNFLYVEVDEEDLE